MKKSLEQRERTMFEEKTMFDDLVSVLRAVRSGLDHGFDEETVAYLEKKMEKLNIIFEMENEKGESK